MQIAIASGKGGTGKTTVATNLAYAAAQTGRSTAYVDCDVEEPNGHIFLRPRILKERPIRQPVPRVNKHLCTACGQCGQVCQYSAIVCVGRRVLIYPELCHGCGACTLFCPTGAISESSRRIGTLRIGRSGAIHCVDGLLDVGEAMSPPAIRAVRRAAPRRDRIFLDAPPGTSCPVVTSIRGCDFVVLVTEPTPFGLHDLTLAVEMVRELRLPFGVVINRADAGDERVRAYCRDQGIDVLAEIPDDREVAEAYSRGRLACEDVPGYRERFFELLAKIEEALSVQARA